MVTKAISGSPLKRVLNRSLTWKESVGMAAPESVAIDKEYATALKEFEAIPDFPDEWAELQERYTKLTKTMRDLETDVVKPDEALRNAHSKRIVDATAVAKELGKDVTAKHKERTADTSKALVAVCFELRKLKERMAKGLPELDPDVEYVKQLEPAMREFAEIVSRYKLLTGRFEKIDEYMYKRGRGLPETVDKMLEKADAAAKKFEASVRGAATRRTKLLEKAAKTPAPPVRKELTGLYGNDPAEMEKARVKFQTFIDDLNVDEQALITGLNEGSALFSSGDFKALNHWIHMIARFDARRVIEEQEASKKGSPKTTGAKSADDSADEAPVPVLPARPRDDSTGRTIRILNPTLAPISVLTNAEEGKVNDFLALQNHVVPSRVRDLMNERFGSFEVVNHQTVRLSRRRRLEFDIDMGTPTEVRITLVNIGDPTYDH